MRYTTLAELNIDPNELEFHTASNGNSPGNAAPNDAAGERATPINPLPIKAAKEAMAAFYGVDVASIEVTIRA